MPKKLEIRDGEKERWEESREGGDKVGGKGQEKIKGFQHLLSVQLNL